MMAAQTEPYLCLRKEAVKLASLQLKDFPGLLERSFIPTEDAESCSEGAEFRVMQWNVLADALSESSSIHNFIKCPSQALHWSNRKHLILQEILTYNPDIICLEEVDHFPDFFKPQLSELGYEGVFTPKVNSPCLNNPDNSGPDGCTIFVDKDRFLLKNSKGIQLQDFDGQKVNQVGLLAKLFDKVEEKVLYCVVVHLKAKPEFEQLRLAQIQYLLRELKEYMKDEPSDVVICGDFNAEDTEPVYAALEDNSLIGMTFNSAYKSATSKEPEFTTFKIRPKGKVEHTIDYIWHTNNLKVTGYLQIPGQDEIGCDGLPSVAYPSDHLSLMFDFCWQ